MGAGRDSLVAENTAGSDDTDRGLTMFHHADLHRRGMCAESDLLTARVFLDKESVLHIASGVVGGEVESGEKMPVVLDFDRFCDSEADASEDVGDLVHDDREDMAATEMRPIGRHREVVGRDVGLMSIDKSLELLNLVLSDHFQLVKDLTQFLFLVIGDRLELFEEISDEALFAEILNAEHLYFESLIVEFFDAKSLNIVDIRFDLIFRHRGEQY